MFHLKITKFLQTLVVQKKIVKFLTKFLIKSTVDYINKMYFCILNTVNWLVSEIANISSVFCWKTIRIYFL